jgi:hypothetical protein
VRRALGAGALALAACASAPAKAPRQEAVELPAAGATVQAPPQERPLPQTLAVLPPDADGYLFIDGARLRKSALFSVITESLASADVDPFLSVKTECRLDPLQLVDQLALAFRGSGTPSVVASFSLQGGPERALECLKQLGAQPLADGSLQVRPGLSATSAAGLLLIGDASAVRLAAARRGPAKTERIAALDPALERFPDAALVGAGSLGSMVPESGFGDAVLALTANDRHFLLRLEAETTDSVSAKAYESAFKRASWLSGAGGKLPAIRLDSEGRRMIFELSVAGPPAEQAERLGVASALAVSSVRRYLARAKEAEAKNTVTQIAKDLVDYIERLPPGARRMPKSAPPTPKEVPRGTAVTLASSDWQHPTWRALAFEMRAPQRYSYEIVTAKNRKSAVVRASGDLDGDGVLSHLSLEVHLDAHGDPIVAESISLENELE